MCLVDKKVNHKVFGEGIIKSCDEKYLHVIFGQEEKIFSYPSVFEKFLTIEDKEAKEKIKADIEALHEKAQMLLEAKKKKEIQYVSQPIEPQKTSTKLLEATKNSLYKGIEQCIIGNHLGDVSHAVQQYAESKGYSINNIDGVRVDFPDGWALVRASNTTPCLTLRFEGNTEEVRDRLHNEFMEVVNKLV